MDLVTVAFGHHGIQPSSSLAGRTIEASWQILPKLDMLSMPWRVLSWPDGAEDQHQVRPAAPSPRAHAV